MNSLFIIGDELNAKHTHGGLRLIAAIGRELHKAAADSGCEIVYAGKPTHWHTVPKRTPDLISLLL
jgi:hypothetical protein